ncbi:MAG: putative bifunctional diguanylate cyclase/phosphodiesterase [Cypionkella sp.]
MRVNPLITLLGPISSINDLIDDAIGAGRLASHVRTKLLYQQLSSMAPTAMALLVGAKVVSLILLVLTWGTPGFTPLLVCLVAINLLHLSAVAIAWEGRGSTALWSPQASVARAMGFAITLGCLWGATLNILPMDDPLMRSAATIGVGGLMCISLMAMINYPQALLGFTVPLTMGALLSFDGLHRGPGFWVQTPLLVGFALLMAIISFRQARLFVTQRVSETTVAERQDITGLLLREFEQNTSDWTWGFDEAGRIRRLSVGFSTVTGLGTDALTGADFVHFLRWITPPDDPLMVQLELDIERRSAFVDVELRVTAGGRECWWKLTGKPVYDHSGVFLGYIGTGSDVTERKIAEERITRLAHHDVMTGLLNRSRFTDQLNQAVARLDRYGTPFSVLLLDLDHFKSVNDTRGHLIGDKLLVMVAERMQHLVRDTDVVARLGGDEFAIIAHNSAVAEQVSSLAGRLLDAIAQPYEIDGDRISIGVSIGIALAPIHGEVPDQILRHAGAALDQAKAGGRRIYRLFESQKDGDARERRLLEVELRDAVRNQELVLYYQPVVCAVDAHPMGFEALIRWNHPIRGLVPPAEFIPIAEQSNLIVEIGDWVIEQACAAAANWPDHLTVSVNLSARHFRRSDISLVVKKALSMSGIAPQRLEIEITERTLIESPDEVIAKLTELRALGVAIAMDDFGTGYSSLSYLLKFPFDKIKIDRSFVAASSTDTVARDILKAIASLGRTLKLKITAEGVETREQAELLSDLACHQLQGFYFVRPLDPIDLPHYLMTSVPTRAGVLKAEAAATLTILAG